MEKKDKELHMQQNSRSLEIFRSETRILYIVVFVFLAILGVLLAIIRWTEPENMMRIERDLKMIAALSFGSVFAVTGLGPIFSRRVRKRLCRSELEFVNFEKNLLSFGICGLLFVCVGIALLLGLI